LNGADVAAFMEGFDNTRDAWPDDLALHQLGAQFRDREFWQ
jgi:hypothetical protein